MILGMDAQRYVCELAAETDGLIALGNGGGGGKNGHPPRVVPVPEPGKARVAAAERLQDDQPS